MMMIQCLLREESKRSSCASQSLTEPVYDRIFLSLVTLMENNNGTAYIKNYLSPCVFHLV